jgi:two-component system, LytTR family, sensor kinase
VTRRRWLVAGLVWAAWTALAVFFAITTSLTYISQDRPPLWGLVLAFALAQWWIWAALTPAVVWVARRAPLTRPRLVQSVVVHLMAGLVAAAIKVNVEGAAREWVFGVRPYMLINNLALQVLIYWALVGAVHALDHFGRSQARAAAAEARLAEAQLQLLRAQLRPHFLFNALNTISELVHEDPSAADRMIGRLSDLLRATLRAGDRHLVPLSEEIALLDHYVAIQQGRFGARLTVEWDVPTACLGFSIPHLLLQPVVENAILHGLSPRASGGAVRIAVGVHEGHLVLSVSDNGVGLADEWKEGIGLAHTRARLRSLFGPRATVVIARRSGPGTTVTMTMPVDGRGAVAP